MNWGIYRTALSALTGTCIALITLVALADTQYRIDREVWAAYQKYAAAIGSTKPGAFAITEDGHGWWYMKCKVIRCAGSTTYRHDAQQGCEKEYKRPCVIFALRQEIIVPYEVRQ